MKLAKIDQQTERKIKLKNLAVMKVQQMRQKELEHKNQQKKLASERAHQRSLQATKDFMLMTKSKIEQKDKNLEMRLISLKNNSHREGNPELKGNLLKS